MSLEGRNDTLFLTRLTSKKPTMEVFLKLPKKGLLTFWKEEKTCGEPKTITKADAMLNKKEMYIHLSCISYLSLNSRSFMVSIYIHVILAYAGK